MLGDDWMIRRESHEHAASHLPLPVRAAWGQLAFLHDTTMWACQHAFTELTASRSGQCHQ